MDNTLKLIIGVLSMTGLLVMVIPNSDPLRGEKDAAAAVAPAAPLPPPPDGESVDGQEDESGDVDANGEVIDEDDGSDFVKMGEPMMDGKPIDPMSNNDFGRSGAQQASNGDGEIIEPGGVSVDMPAPPIQANGPASNSGGSSNGIPQNPGNYGGYSGQ